MALFLDKRDRNIKITKDMVNDARTSWTMKAHSHESFQSL